MCFFIIKKNDLINNFVMKLSYKHTNFIFFVVFDVGVLVSVVTALKEQASEQFFISCNIYIYLYVDD